MSTQHEFHFTKIISIFMILPKNRIWAYMAQSKEYTQKAWIHFHYIYNFISCLFFLSIIQQINFIDNDNFYSYLLLYCIILNSSSNLCWGSSFNTCTNFTQLWICGDYPSIQNKNCKYSDTISGRIFIE